MIGRSDTVSGSPGHRASDQRLAVATAADGSVIESDIAGPIATFDAATADTTGMGSRGMPAATIAACRVEAVYRRVRRRCHRYSYRR